MLRTVPKVVGALALGVVLIVPASGHACVTDAECDNGDVCSVPDTCVAGSCQLGGGGDTNGDLACDAELDADTAASLTKLTLRRKTSLYADNSAAKGGGDLFSLGSGAFSGAAGFSVRVKDILADVSPLGDGIDATVTWLESNCIIKPVGTTVCRSADKRSSIRFRPNKLVAAQFKFDFKIKGIGDLTGPFFGPVRMVLTHGGNKRIADAITDCKLLLSGLRCREF
jgi:hypothetical protein